jgi:hypothetical protein
MLDCHKSNIEVSAPFCLSSLCDGSVEGECESRFVADAIERSRRVVEFRGRHQFRVTRLLRKTIMAHCESKVLLTAYH